MPKMHGLKSPATPLHVQEVNTFSIAAFPLAPSSPRYAQGVHFIAYQFIPSMKQKALHCDGSLAYTHPCSACSLCIGGGTDVGFQSLPECDEEGKRRIVGWGSFESKHLCGDPICLQWHRKLSRAAHQSAWHAT